MIIALDIDDTITARLEFFSVLSCSPGVKRVLIVSSRSNLEEVKQETRRELARYNIRFDVLHLLEGHEVAGKQCPHAELDWHQKYLWQKVDFCLRNQVSVVFEDDEKTIALFRKYAPAITVMQVR